MRGSARRRPDLLHPRPVVLALAARRSLRMPRRTLPVVVLAGAGDFLYVPPHAIHREGNPSGEQSGLVVVRAGTGPAVVNVDGPARG